MSRVLAVNTGRDGGYIGHFGFYYQAIIGSIKTSKRNTIRTNQRARNENRIKSHDI